MFPRAAAACLLALALAAATATGAAAQQQEGVFEFKSKSAAKVLIIGKTANLKIYPNKTSSAFLTLKFNRVEELDAAGKGVLGHAVAALSAATPAYTTGVRTSGDTDYTYVKMVFDDFKLPECPDEDSLADSPTSVVGEGGSVVKGSGPAKGAKPGAKAAAAAAAAAPPEIVAEAGAPVKTLGDPRLAATIAALTADAGLPPLRPEMISARRRLAGFDGSLRDGGKDPFAGIVSAPKQAGGQVSVVKLESAASAPAPGRGAGPAITLTFFFGMTANKTFAYGKGNVVTVPADGVKFNIEASNWPFCSPLNSLRFDIAVATNMAAGSQGQMLADPTAAEAAAAQAGMITDIYAPPLRRLLQPADPSGTYLDMETAAALANAGKAKRPRLPTRTAKLLIGPTQAAAIECATVAYPSVGSAINSTVGVSLVSTSGLASNASATALANATLAAISSANALGGSKLSLTFPYFETLYYDPVISFGGIDGMQVSIVEAKNGSCTGVVCGRTAERRVNGAAGRGAGAFALAAAAALAVLLL